MPKPKCPQTCQAALITGLLIGSSLPYSLSLGPLTPFLLHPWAPNAPRCASRSERQFYHRNMMFPVIKAQFHS